MKTKTALPAVTRLITNSALASIVIDKLNSGRAVLIDKTEYDALVADAKQMRQIRARVVDYRSSLPPEKRAATESPYVRWARENMKAPA